MRGLFYQRVRVGQITILRTQREAVMLLVYAVVLVGVSLGTGLIIKQIPAPILGAKSFTHSWWYVVGFKLFFMLSLPLLWFWKSGYSLKNLEPGFAGVRKTMIWSGIAFFCGFILNAGQLRGICQTMRSGVYHDLPVRIGLAILVPLISAGIPEEFYFRGLLQTRLEAVAGRIVAILVSVCLFCAWHLPTRYLLAYGVEGQAGNFRSVLIGTGLPVFIVGLILAWLYDRYRALVPLIALHWGIDLIPALASFFGMDR